MRCVCVCVCASVFVCPSSKVLAQGHTNTTKPQTAAAASERPPACRSPIVISAIVVVCSEVDKVLPYP